MFAKDKVPKSLVDAVEKVMNESSPAREGEVAAGAGSPAEKGALAAKYSKKTKNEAWPGTKGGYQSKASSEFEKKKVGTGTVYQRKAKDDTGESQPEKKEPSTSAKFPTSTAAGYDDRGARFFAQQVKKGNQSVSGKADGVRGKKNESVAFKDKLLEIAKLKQEQAQEDYIPEEALVEMSAKQMKKREKIVKSMKDKTSYFKKKYGSRWKNVMYATATKQAMGEEIEIEEAVDSSPEARTTDMLRGRVKGGKSNDFKSFKIKISNESDVGKGLSEKAHEDEKEDKKLIKKMVDKSCLKSEETEITEAKDPGMDAGLGSQPDFATNESGRSPVDHTKQRAKTSLMRLKSHMGKK